MKEAMFTDSELKTFFCCSNKSLVRLYICISVFFYNYQTKIRDGTIIYHGSRHV